MSHLKPRMGSGPPPGIVIGPGLIENLPALIPALVKLLQPHFLPASYSSPPNAQGNNGGRTIALNTQAPETQVVKMSAGLATIAFQQDYGEGPIVGAIPVTPTGGTNVFALHIYGTVSTQGCVIRSASNTDERDVHVTILRKFTPNAL